MEDILDSAKAILEHTKNTNSYNDFVNNRLIFRAVERELTIIAEALNKIKQENAILEINHTQQIIGLRNRIVHDYANTNQEIVWGVVVNHINPLIAEIENWINKNEQQLDKN
jgi:uncharacterized protein with HEPN domain